MKNIQPNLPGWTKEYFAYLENIQTVIDVGVCDGTVEIYRPFPKAYLVLVEPLPEKKERCQKILKERKGEYYNLALGKENTIANFYRHKKLPQCSSLYISQKTDREKFQIEIKTMDSLFLNKKYKQHILLKVDTEGADYDVILGGYNFLSKVKYAILEVPIKQRAQSPHVFADYISLMAHQNFHLLDIMRITRKNPTSPDAFIADCLFINRRLP